MEKLFISADELLKDSFKLAWIIFESGFKPDYIVGVWRGGAPVGIAIQEFLKVLGIKYAIFATSFSCSTFIYFLINISKDYTFIGDNYISSLSNQTKFFGNSYSYYATQ